ncbi:maleylpyruvate isomerase family mycothiol-dependent enzyme [Virgisporangium ochraceum]|uniref:Maleylpyruvate isomerase family mycothiol-dependent enzyme n=1 Tax=Virgisporangium ochraceum TaxID=65505 RepID=A0A8J3ZVP9_9ACTN|nr:maleylpyruvate isomerase family mycothiol-dependent enzyme [Virgisporangium ochraceum]GIJ71239.1 hypothetical protein Voc01_061560 [Virgisporangium ochraceum]
MPTHLTVERHVDAIADRGATLATAARAAGLDAPVPTCPRWDVRALLAHQGGVHRWAAANLRGEKDPAKPEAPDDVLPWYDEGLDALVRTVRSTADDVKAMVFLKDAPPPRAFWARRQAHETTIHSVDAMAAAHGAVPPVADLGIAPDLAADGIDELLTGFITRGKGQLHASPGYVLLVRADDTGHAWTLRVGDGPVTTTVGNGPADVEFAGTAAQVYVSLWNRADELTVKGPAETLAEWRKAIRIRWR